MSREAVNALFRSEAIAHHGRSPDEEGDVIRYERKWPQATYKLLMFSAVASFLFISLFSVNEYATGPAVVRIEGRRVITATEPATVEEIAVRPGQLVQRASVLVHMHDVDQQNELARANRELDLQLVRMLRDPKDTDNTVKQSIASLRATRDQAKNILQARTITADFDGYVTDVRVKPGQHVNAGEVILALAPAGDARASLVAMISAEYRPMLKSGLSMRFELDGFRYEYADLELVDVATEAVGSLEVQRFLGSERADAVTLEPGAKVLVTARLPAATFSSEGHPYGYFDGLTGTANIRVRREPILVTLVPALREWLAAAPLSERVDRVTEWVSGRVHDHFR